MLVAILGGLAYTAVLICLALPLRRWKVDKLVAALVVAAGLGPVFLIVWLVGLVTNTTTIIVIGVIALCLLLWVGLHYVKDAKDGTVDQPLRGLALLPLLVVVIMTGTDTFGFLMEQAESGTDAIMSQVK
ncbi:hypothetical protein [Streptosporangium sp. NPDC001681]|uniref:hypothetical protein n=1 Tax=Streptosporangium sp. NPDC001681 TaxID=3154395 RepID=UPI003331B22D